jgi:hypothetical protein
LNFEKLPARENRGRCGLRDWYSRTLQQRAVEYWRIRHGTDEGVRRVAAALGVASWSLHRWIRVSKTH